MKKQGIEKNVVKALVLGAALCAVSGGMALAESAPEDATQFASAYLDQDGTAVCAKIDLTGGWSVEFSQGAFYLYDGSEDDAADAIGVTLDKDVYEEYLVSAKDGEDYKELENGVSYSDEMSTYIVMNIEDAAYFLLDVPKGQDAEAICSRVSLQTEASILNPAAAYEGSWVSDRAALDIDVMEDAITATIHWGNSATESTEWTYQCMFDEVTGGLTTLENGVKTNVTYAEDGTVASSEVVYEDGAANFLINEEGKLVWTDFKEAAGENEIVFEMSQE